MGTVSTFNKSKYAYFLKKLVVKLKYSHDVDYKKIAIVANNCRFHRANIIKEFLKKWDILWIFIPRYSPEINPCEKLINMIKAHIKSQIDMQK